MRSAIGSMRPYGEVSDQRELSSRGMAKVDLLGMDLRKMEELVCEMGEKPFRARQLMKWIYEKGAESFAQMTDLSKDLRERLEEVSYLGSMRLVKRVDSRFDGATKFLFELEDGERVETVLIREGGRRTICLSTQVGCPLGCTFCATGRIGLKRNLRAGEIVDQVIEVERLSREKPTNLVLMGMGEPLLNYEEVLNSLSIFNSPYGLGIGARKITLSTAGLVPQIERLAKEEIKVGLAISLNATTDRVRDWLMPINRRYPLGEILRAAKRFTQIGKRRLTFEYLLLAGVNDSFEDATRLAKLVKGIPCKINLIPYNHIAKGEFKRPDTQRVELFKRWLYPLAPTVTLRESKGRDIGAACGQLRALY